MEHNIKTLLKEYGLKDEEVEVYLVLVVNSELTAYRIAKETRIHKSTCYDILERLFTRGFVGREEKEGKMLFYANSVSEILAKIKNKEQIILSIAPELERLERKQETRVRHLDTSESQKEFDINLIESAKKGRISFVYCIGNGKSSQESLNLLIERLINEVRKEKLHKKIDYRAVWDLKQKNSDCVGVYEKLGENRFLESIPTRATTVIFDEYVIFLYTKKNAEVIEIKSKEVSEEMKAYFLHLWKIARK